MSKTLKPQAAEVCINKDFLNYIIVPPEGVAKLFLDSASIMETIALRQNNVKYKDALEDKFLDTEKGCPYEADLYWHDDTQHKYIYVRNTGRLYRCDHILQVVEVIKVLLDNEANKIIK